MLGNGTTINILEDPWLPMQHEAYVQTNSLTLQGQMVSSLMDDSGNWDIDLILDVFDNRDANLILSIPLDTGVQDSWYWRQEKLGCYSVKSVLCYRI